MQQPGIAASVHNLPAQATLFIGRQDELNELATLLANPHCRLLTLVGLGGIGKTRLAIEVARRVQADYPDGVYFVPLQPLQSGDQIVSTVMNTLGIQAVGDPHEQLLAFLRDKCLLLLLDTVEHLLDGVDLVAAILTQSPQVKLLVTSRESLHLQDEWLREIKGLAYPAEPDVQPSDNYSAVQLFVERAQQLRGDLDIEGQYRPIVNICQLVEGMPLALELAAGWVKTLSCEQIVDELQQNLDILATRAQDRPERHRSMQAVFDHSWHLLSDTERTVLQRMTVFRGGCTREAAEQVTGATLVTLASLVEKSLLRHDPDSGRYDMQELLRQYAEEQLVQSGKLDLVRDLHCDYFARLLDHLHTHGQQYEPSQIWDTVEVDFENVRGAWARALEHDDYEAINSMLFTTWAYASNRGRCVDALDLYETASERLANWTTDREQYILGRVLTNLGKSLADVQRWEAVESASRNALEIAREQGNPRETANAMPFLACAQWYQGQHLKAIQTLSECIDLFGRLDGCEWYMGKLQVRLANYLGATGQPERCLQLNQESLSILRQFGSINDVADAHDGLGTWYLRSGQWDQAEKHLAESYRLYQDCGHKSALIAYVDLGRIAAAKGQFEDARQIVDYVLLHTKTGTLPHRYSKVIALSLSSLLADAQDDPFLAQQLAEEAVHLAEQLGDVFAITPAKFALGWALCNQEESTPSLEHLGEFLRTALRWQAAGHERYGIAAFARILAHSGERTHAAELLGLVFTHPNSPCVYLEKHQGMTQLRTDLEAALGTEAYTTAWERGTQLDVEQVARDLLREFGAEPDDPVMQANQALPDPLTPRELEVLGLLAEGLTNRQIAEQLVITRGTVRGHLNKLYSKLAVENRVQAITHAQETGLL